MRIKNKEIKARRHRKEQKQKEALRAIRAASPEKTKAAAAKPAAKKKPAK